MYFSLTEMSAGYGKPLCRQEAFVQGPDAARYQTCRCPVAEDLCSTSGLWILHPMLLGTEQDMHDIVRIFGKIKEHFRS